MRDNSAAAPYLAFPAARKVCMTRGPRPALHGCIGLGPSPGKVVSCCFWQAHIRNHMHEHAHCCFSGRLAGHLGAVLGCLGGLLDYLRRLWTRRGLLETVLGEIGNPLEPPSRLCDRFVDQRLLEQ